MKIKILSALVMTAALLNLQGCVSGATVEGMTTKQSVANPADLVNSVKVLRTSGGHETNPLWASKVSNDDFTAALIASLRAAKLLGDNNQGPYTLDADLDALDQPVFAFDSTVTAHVHYKLTDAKGKTIFDEMIVTPYTATVSDAFVGVVRLRLANEGAIRANIDALLAKLVPMKIAAAISLN